MCDTRYLSCKKVCSQIRVESIPLRNLYFMSKNDNIYYNNSRLNDGLTFTDFHGVASSCIRPFLGKSI